MCNILKRILIAGVIIAMGMGLAGCTKAEDGTDDVSASAVEAEGLPGAEGAGDGTDTGAGKRTGAGADTVDAETGNTEDAVPEGGRTSDGPDGQQDGDSAGERQDGGNGSSLNSIPDGESDLCGKIYEIGDKQFTVTEIYTETLDDGTLMAIDVAPGAEEASAKITIVYDENTVFEKQRIWNGGADHEEKAATAASLQNALTADMWGSYEGDVFHADAVRIIEVIL